MRIFPKKDDENNTWFSFIDVASFDSTDAVFVKQMMPVYYGSVKSALLTGEWDVANENLGYIKTFQNKFGSHIFPPVFKTKLEILYNNINIFKRLFPFLAAVGFLMLIMLFIQIINPKAGFKWPIRIGIWLVVFGFILQTLGLTSRWYVSGHAPWSNGYEAMLYISWTIVLAGIAFAKTKAIPDTETARQ